MLGCVWTRKEREMPPEHDVTTAIAPATHLLNFVNPEKDAMSQTKNGRKQQFSPRELLEGTFVERDEFCRLLLSVQRMVRSDEPAVNLRGVRDLATGRRYLIEQEKLLAH
jgi:hypothetical protein